MASTEPTFRTTIQPEDHRGIITHDSRIVMLGSCFTDEIGSRLTLDGFRVTHNPLGAIYNPATMADILSTALLHQYPATAYDDSSYVFNQGLWHCMMSHTRLSRPTLQEARQATEQAIDTLRSALLEADTLILTFGSAFAYFYPSVKRYVANCHKLPADRFERTFLSLEDLMSRISQSLHELPNRIRLIVTVSPIRHIADGMHQNTLSKSTLMLLADQLVRSENQFRKAFYFPAYEIMMDDLRDYRFYAPDMKHPSAVAVDYIYDIFRRTYMEPDTIARADSERRNALRSMHRPINDTSSLQ